MCGVGACGQEVATYITHPGAPFGSSARWYTNFLNSLFSTGLVLPSTRRAYYSMFSFLHHWIGAWQLLASILIQAVRPINTVNRTLMFKLMLLELVQFEYFVKIIITVHIYYIYICSFLLTSCIWLIAYIYIINRMTCMLS